MTADEVADRQRGAVLGGKDQIVICVTRTCGKNLHGLPPPVAVKRLDDAGGEGYGPTAAGGLGLFELPAAFGGLGQGAPDRDRSANVVYVFPLQGEVFARPHPGHQGERKERSQRLADMARVDEDWFKTVLSQMFCTRANSKPFR